MNKEIIIIGYDLDSCITARKKANEGYKVTHIKTGKLGYPLDDIQDYISYEDVKNLKELKINTEFKILPMGVFAYIPYDDIKFINTRNGLFSWPLCESSFESAEEWDETISSIISSDSLKEKLVAVTNQVNVYKNTLPKWLFDSVIKFIGCNKWAGIRQSKMTKDGLFKEVDLSNINNKIPNIYYSPVKGYQSLCLDLLNHPNIVQNKIDIKNVRKFLDRSWINKEIYLSDNRVDYIFGYTFGVLERVDWQCKEVKENTCEELLDVGSSIVLTPTLEHWVSVNNLGKTYRIFSNKILDLSYTEQSMLIPAQANVKCLSEYANFMKLQKNKILLLHKTIYTVIS